AGAGDDRDGQDGVAAEFEEVVVDADLVQAQDVGPDGGDGVFGGGGRGGVPGGGVLFGGGQGAAVEFAVGGQGEGVQGDERGGDHVVGEGGGQVGAQVGGVWGGGAGGGGQVGGELFAAGGVFAGDDGGGGEGGVVERGGLDLA